MSKDENSRLNLKLLFLIVRTVQVRMELWEFGFWNRPYYKNVFYMSTPQEDLIMEYVWNRMNNFIFP